MVPSNIFTLFVAIPKRNYCMYAENPRTNIFTASATLLRVEIEARAAVT